MHLSSRELSGAVLTLALASAACRDGVSPEGPCPPVELPSVVSRPCADGDTRCARYLGIWEEQLRDRNGMTPEYFAEHVVPHSARLESWSAGKSFRVEYSVRIGWATIPEFDSFVVFLKRSDAYAYLPLPRDTYLSKAEVELVLDEEVFSSSVTRVVPVEALAFCSQADALAALRKGAGTHRIEFRRLSFRIPGRLPRENGHPQLFGFGILDRDRNRCVSGRVDLVDRSVDASPTLCEIVGS